LFISLHLHRERNAIRMLLAFDALNLDLAFLSTAEIKSIKI
jgi:hypothetical protein